MSKRIVTFGEIMLRLAPNGYYRFFQDDQLQATFGGGEANVAVSLANYGMDAAFVTKLPAHAIGQGAVNALRGLGVDTRSIVRGGDRIGIYYLEKGASQRGSVCIYDRAHSAIQEAQPSDFDWDAIFDGADWFHFTGITPALGSNLVEICKEACVAAKKHGVKISCDLNYRGKLWTREQARAAMTELCQYVDVCISNEEDAKDVVGITGLPAHWLHQNQERLRLGIPFYRLANGDLIRFSLEEVFRWEVHHLHPCRTHVGVVADAP